MNFCTLFTYSIFSGFTIDSAFSYMNTEPIRVFQWNALSQALGTGNDGRTVTANTARAELMFTCFARLIHNNKKTSRQQENNMTTRKQNDILTTGHLDNTTS